MRWAARVRGSWLAGVAAIALGGWAGVGAHAADAGGKQPEPGKPFRLPSVALKSQIIWDAACEGPDGCGLAFGGQDQLADRGQPPTRIRLDGEWQDIRDELRQKNVLQPHSDAARKLARQQKDAIARARHAYLEGLAPDAERERLTRIAKAQDELRAAIARFAGELPEPREKRPTYEGGQLRFAGALLARAKDKADEAARNITPTGRPNAIEQMGQAQVDLESRGRGVRRRAAGPDVEPDRL